MKVAQISCAIRNSAIAMGLLAALPATAAENGTGFYLLGSKGPMAGVVPEVPGIYFQNDFYFYSADLAASKKLPTGGKVLLGVKGQAALELPTFLMVVPEEILGGRLGLSTTVPVGWMKTSADLSLSGPLLGRRDASVSDSVFTFGDPVVGGVLGWNAGDFHWSVGTMVNVPIGDYQKDEISNIAFHHWAADVNAAATYFDPTTGWDFSGAMGVSFNAENPATDYRSGNEFHFEGSIEKHFNPQFSAGVLGYYYKQLTGDSGDGATLGAYKGEVAALGATVAWNFKFGETPLSARLKYYHEFGSQNRAEGDAVFATISMPLSIFKPLAQ